MLLEEVPFMAKTRFHQAKSPGLYEHQHCDCIEVFLMEHGEVEWWVEKETHKVGVGDIFINRPGEHHGSTGIRMRPCGYVLFQLKTLKKIPGLSRAQSRRILKALSNKNIRRFPSTPLIRTLFGKLWQSHVDRGEFAELQGRAYLHLLLIELTDCLEKHSNKHNNISQTIRKTLSIINPNPCENYSVSELAALSGLGRTQFNERFRKETGFTPAEYIRRCRLDLAKKRLQTESTSITRLAAELGFSSSQHFATTFKQFEALSPKEFRNQFCLIN